MWKSGNQERRPEGFESGTLERLESDQNVARSGRSGRDFRSIWSAVVSTPLFEVPARRHRSVRSACEGAGICLTQRTLRARRSGLFRGTGEVRSRSFQSGPHQEQRRSRIAQMLRWVSALARAPNGITQRALGTRRVGLVGGTGVTDPALSRAGHTGWSELSIGVPSVPSAQSVVSGCSMFAVEHYL